MVGAAEVITALAADALTAEAGETMAAGGADLGVVFDRNRSAGTVLCGW